MRKAILKQAHKSLFTSRKKISGDVTISRDGTINRYEGGLGSTFGKQYNEYILFEIGYMANDPISVFEMWEIIKQRIDDDYSLQKFLSVIN